uniref:Uncharacterized protein n=1 Tax=Citrobacter freundii TaxID=546 RepID=A0A2I7QFA4_CITFR|nr:hypothetical protein pCf587_0226 [Citrobacter freundii]
MERATSSIQPHSIDSLTTHHCLNNIGECRRVELFNTKNRIAFLLNWGSSQNSENKAR